MLKEERRRSHSQARRRFAFWVRVGGAAGPRAGRGAQPLVQQHTFQENENRANWAFDNLTYISTVEMYVKSADGCRPTRPMPSLYSSPTSKSALTPCRLSHTCEARARTSGVGWRRSGTIAITKPPAAPGQNRRLRQAQSAGRVGPHASASRSNLASMRLARQVTARMGR